ncbi:MAG: hypothetical protein ABIK85_04070 [Candidatus Eisenbacteria bacterium]
MTDAARRYEELTRQLLEGRARGEFGKGSPGEAREDELLERMDDCWWEMSEAERDEADRRLEESRRISAPDELDAVDVKVPSGGDFMPRQVAA